MSRCIIHVGTRKTGTSSIQRSLNGYSSATWAYGEIAGHPNHGAALHSLFADSPATPGFRRRNRRNGGIEAYARDAGEGLERGLDRARGKTVIYCGEAICHLFRAHELRRLCEYFLKRFTSVEVVAYVRPPVAYMGSNFQQRVKDAAGNIDLSRDYLNFRHTFAKFDEVFGRENVRLWKFDTALFPEGCVVRDFCGRLGIDFPAQRIVRVNESLSREALGLLFTYRKLGRSMGSTSMTASENRSMVRQLSGIGSTRFRFSPDAVRPVLEQNSGDIEWMEERLGTSLREDLGEHGAGAVRDEADLLTPDPAAVGQLLSLLGTRAPPGLTGATPREVASLIHALRAEKAVAQGMQDAPTVAMSPKARENQRGGIEMDIAQLIEHLRRRDPGLLEGISQSQAEELVRNVFRQVNETLAATEEGMVKYVGLGQFRVRKVEREVDGKNVVRTQIVFRRAAPDHSAKRDEA